MAAAAATHGTAAQEDQQHLRRSLEAGPAIKPPVNFEYTTVAFRTKPSGSSRLRRPSGRPHKVFGAEPPLEGGYRALEVISGDRRVLFEEPAQQRQQQQPHARGEAQLAVPSATAAAAAGPQKDEAGSARAPARARGGQKQLQQAGLLEQQLRQPGGRSAPASSPGVRQGRPQQAAKGGAVAAGSQKKQLGGQPQVQQPAASTAPSSPTPDRAKGRSSGGDDGFLQRAAAQLGVNVKQLCVHRSLRSQVQLFQGCPDDLAALVGALRGGLGLSPTQLRHIVMAQPLLLELRLELLLERAAAVAAVLEVPLPSRELAQALASTPDVLMRKGCLTETREALAAALQLPAEPALWLLRREPQLLYTPPAFFRQCVALLESELGLAAADARQLAGREAQLLSTPPSVLSRNLAMLRKECQLDTPLLAAMVQLVPSLVCRSPGQLRAATHRLLALLHGDDAWRTQLPRLLASPRNLAVALSFDSGRYVRLDYLHHTGRGAAMSFKEALSVEADEFHEVFPEFEAWRRQRSQQG